MARKTSISVDTLAPLGVEKLAQVILDEAEINPSFRKRVTAALAGAKGPESVAKLIDRRLAALEKARAMVAWDKERALAVDLGATVDTIVRELGPLSPMQAFERLLRFIDTHPRVFERIDDSGGHIQAAYWTAAEAIPDLVRKLHPDELPWVPQRLLVSLSQDTHRLALSVAVAVAPLLPEAVLVAWDTALLKNNGDDAADSLEIRQAIADARGDFDAYVALELCRPEWRQNPLKLAERMLDANRLDEALHWIRREKKGGLKLATGSDLADGRIRSFHAYPVVTHGYHLLIAPMADRDILRAKSVGCRLATCSPPGIEGYAGRRTTNLALRRSAHLTGRRQASGATGFACCPAAR